MNELKDKNIIAVYGTLKRGMGNYGVMERAKGNFVKETYIEFEKIQGSGFPIALFKQGTKKFLKVELFEVDKEGVEGPLDRLEGYPSFYGRKEVDTIDGDKAIVYEIARPFELDQSDNFIEKEIKKEGYEDCNFYSWK